ncbi:MAG: peptide chain release factor N(5)-glutamine methyltransferase [Alphaproteobacteria bacterium]|nr:peptide chain release factor N(5)-glutamine methyltransferase [Alphaproteobacteria bacterium]
MQLCKAELKQICGDYNITIRDLLLLLQHILNTSYSKLFFSDLTHLSDMQYSTLICYVNRRSNNEPISKIIGYKYFYKNKFCTNKYTLDPRPETELIVELFTKYFINKNDNLKILDLGCGTGCIGLSILLLYKNAKLHLSDISHNVLLVAEHNAKSLDLINRCKLIESNWFEKIYDTYDAIVSNPPYICSNYNLDKEVLYDPPEALFAGEDGMNAYNIILPNASEYLKNNGKLFIEIGYDQSEKIQQIHSDLEVIEIAKDLNNINRVVLFNKK